MQIMSPEEVRAFLLSGQRTGKLATVKKDGKPHVVPIWFDLDGDEIVFTTWHTTTKAANLRRDPAVAFCVDDEAPPYAFVEIEGSARLDEHAPDLFYWSRRIAERYLGAQVADAYGKRNAVDGEILVRVRPLKVIGQREIAS